MIFLLYTGTSALVYDHTENTETQCSYISGDHDDLDNNDDDGSHDGVRDGGDDDDAGGSDDKPEPL